MIWTEVRVSFAGILVEVTHLRPGQNFTLGESPEADLTYATPGLHRLVAATETGAVIAQVGSGELVALGSDEHRSVQLGPITLEIACGPQLVPELRRRPIDRGWWLSLASTALVVATFLGLNLLAAESQLPPLETDSDAYLAYTVRSEPVAEDDPKAPPPSPVREARPKSRTNARRGPARPSDARTPAPLPYDPGADDWPSPADVAQIARTHQGPRAVGSTLQRDSSPTEAARSSGVLGSMPDEEEIETFVGTAAANFDPNVDDRELWAAMTDGPPSTSIAGLELTGSGRSGGVASEIVRSDAPSSPRSKVPSLAKCVGSECDDQLRVRVVDTRIEGALDDKRTRRFANSLRNQWLACLRPGEAPVSFELSYAVQRDGSVERIEVPHTQLSAKSRRCIITAVEAGTGPGPTSNGWSAKVVHRVEVQRGPRRP